jgi:hypothetical protein
MFELNELVGRQIKSIGSGGNDRDYGFLFKAGFYKLDYRCVRERSFRILLS